MPWPIAPPAPNESRTRKDNPMARRTTHRSTTGKKLYAVRDASGRFKDIQTYERAHRADLKQSTSGERTTAARKVKSARTAKGAKKR
jgi:hypothetical protein